MRFTLVVLGLAVAVGGGMVLALTVMCLPIPAMLPAPADPLWRGALGLTAAIGGTVTASEAIVTDKWGG